MTAFEKIKNNNDIKQTIKSTFDVGLTLDGDWGYTEEQATIIEATQSGMPLLQLEHMITSMRAHLEMNLTQEKENRYSGINANEISREESKNDKLLYDIVTYEITAIKEDLYTQFINEYKEGYGKEDFDINEHFKRRKEATLIREVVHYFEVSSIK